MVDDDEVTRAGLLAILGGHPDISHLVAFSHTEAMATAPWDRIDVALVDAVDPRCHPDQFPGVAVAERLRNLYGRGRPRVVAVSDVPDEAVRLRMREAGAHLFLHRSQLLGADALCDALLRTRPDEPMAPLDDLDLLNRLGVTRCTRINAGVAAAFDEQLVPDAGWVGPRGRDRLARRTRFNERAHLRPVTTEGIPLDRDQEVPSLRQIQRFVAWATRIERPTPATTAVTQTRLPLPPPSTRTHQRSRSTT